jgi:hypothetical protein
VVNRKNTRRRRYAEYHQHRLTHWVFIPQTKEASELRRIRGLCPELSIGVRFMPRRESVLPYLIFNRSQDPEERGKENESRGQNDGQQADA